MLKLDSEYFDMVRAQPLHRRRRRIEIFCSASGCRAEGLHPAPKGRGQGRIWFCPAHISAYNKSYNFFAGMNPAEIEAWQSSAIWGHRPLRDFAPTGGNHKRRVEDIFRFFTYKQRAKPVDPKKEAALRQLDLPADASRQDIKARFKYLVKLYHPDNNNGGQRDAKKLVEIIEAYNHLQ